jgi:hemolysin activation/secretion protein
MLRTFHAGFFSLILSGISLFSLGNAMAQDIPGSADPGQASRNLRERIAPLTVTPDIQVKGMAIGRAPAGADKVHFTLTELRLEGVTAYKESELQEIYEKYIGQTVSLADIYSIAAELTAKYRNDGYILTQIIVPPQTIDAGIVRLRVVEGTIDKVHITGKTGEEEKDLSLMRRYASQVIHPGRPLNIKELERALLLINDLPGVEARSVIAPSKARTGAADLIITVDRDPYDAFLGIDNYGSRFLGRWGASAGGSLNSALFHANEKISSQIVYVPHGPLSDHELAYISGSYWLPVGGMGTSLEAFYSYTDTEPGLDLREFEVQGRSHYLSVTLEHPFVRTRALNLTGRILLDGRNVENENNIPDNREDNIRALRAGGRLESIDTLFSGGLNSLDVEFSKGLNMLGASDKHDANLSRPDGDPQFLKLEAEARRLQHLGGQFNLLLGAKGQLSNAAQLSAEEFGIGGSSYGRGYDPSEIVGDDGIAGKIELQWNPLWQMKWINRSQIFGFWDAGKVWNDDATTDKVESLASAGLGFRADLVSDIQTEFYVAVPLTREIEAEHDDDARFFLSINKRF